MNNYKINYLWELNSQLGYNWTYGDYLPLLGNPFFRNHRMIYVPSGIIGIQKNYTAGSRIRFGNLAELLFFNFGIQYRITEANYMSKPYNTESLSYYTTGNKNNTGQQLMLNAEISKTFNPIKLVLTLLPGFTQAQSTLMQQNILIDNKSNLGYMSLKLEFKRLKNMYVAYLTTGKASWQDNNLTDKLLLKDMGQKISVFYFPKTNIDISVSSDYTLFEIEKTNIRPASF